eukprot:2994723-Prymnesium_polylepis.2
MSAGANCSPPGAFTPAPCGGHGPHARPAPPYVRSPARRWWALRVRTLSMVYRYRGGEKGPQGSGTKP